MINIDFLHEKLDFSHLPEKEKKLTNLFLLKEDELNNLNPKEIKTRCNLAIKRMIALAPLVDLQEVFTDIDGGYTIFRFPEESHIFSLFEYELFKVLLEMKKNEKENSEVKVEEESLMVLDPHYPHFRGKDNHFNIEIQGETLFEHELKHAFAQYELLKKQSNIIVRLFTFVDNDQIWYGVTSTVMSADPKISRQHAINIALSPRHLSAGDFSLLDALVEGMSLVAPDEWEELRSYICSNHIAASGNDMNIITTEEVTQCLLQSWKERRLSKLLKGGHV